MLGEMIEMAKLVEDCGFDVLTYSEHHFFQMGLLPAQTRPPTY